MISRHRQKVLYFFALLLLVATNAVVLGRVYSNRTGTPDSSVELTERELRPMYNYSSLRENSGLALDIIWRAYNSREKGYGSWSSYTSPDWLDAEKLRQLGFRIPASEIDQDYLRDRPQPLPIKVFVVLEMNSPLHQQVIARLAEMVAEARHKLQLDPKSKELQAGLKNAESNLENEKVSGSRLFAIEAGRNADILRRQYPDRSRWIIARAIIRMSRDSLGKTSQIRGWIEQLGIQRINVAKGDRQIHAFFESSVSHGWTYNQSPRYKATLAYGKNYEPWLVAINPM